MKFEGEKGVEDVNVLLLGKIRRNRGMNVFAIFVLKPRCVVYV